MKALKRLVAEARRLIEEPEENEPTSLFTNTPPGVPNGKMRAYKAWTICRKCGKKNHAR